MPLPHDSLSHGRIAFGFFNIDSDMLLLENLFFFADAFCAAISQLAASDQPEPRAELPGFRIDDPAQIGDLTGAIRGVRLSGFIGALYRRYPFPVEPDGFKQKPEGHRTQAEVRELMARYAAPRALSIGVAGDELHIAEYRFSRRQARELLDYVWRGGMPRWRDETPPGYAVAMRDVVERQASGFFCG
ncbi:MAG: hypothetical protein JXR83_10875 [Deltaproteobacteria bacterium]|nr:hypothetical protein [Deltaproteobacteria bacterium]